MKCLSNYWKTLDTPLVNIRNENRKITAGQENGYITGCLLDYLNFSENYILNAINLSEQQALDAYPKAILHVKLGLNRK